jgi:hypothetical protein
MKQYRDTDYYVTKEGEIYKKFGGFYTPSGKNPNGSIAKPRWRPLKYKRLKQQTNKGYKVYSFFIDGKYTHKGIHQLVAECFIGLCPEGYEVDHIDESRDNNCYTNLQYLTKEENISKAHKNKSMTLGKTWKK